MTQVAVAGNSQPSSAKTSDCHLPSPLAMPTREAEVASASFGQLLVRLGGCAGVASNVGVVGIACSMALRISVAAETRLAAELMKRDGRVWVLALPAAWLGVILRLQKVAELATLAGLSSEEVRDEAFARVPVGGRCRLWHGCAQQSRHAR